jgi:hypothetical protein
MPITLPLVPFGIETFATETGSGKQLKHRTLTVLRLWLRNPKKIAKNPPTTNALTIAVRSTNRVIHLFIRQRMAIRHSPRRDDAGLGQCSGMTPEA